MTVLRTRIALILAIALALVLVPLVAHADTNHQVIDRPGEVDCQNVYPDHPIKGMTFDARSGAVSTQCYTQTYWDMNMIGGQVFDDFRAAVNQGSNYDEAAVNLVISDWKAEKAAIEALRTDAENRAQVAADAHPGDMICKAWSYTSKYNGSGGGSVCMVSNTPVDVSVKHPVANPATDSVVSESLSAATPVAVRYFAKAAATPKFQGAKLKFTLPKAPKGTKLTVFKSAGSDCSLKGRVVKASVTGTCELTMTITKKGAILGTQKLTFTRG
jgi:hypothetical protein